MILADSITCQVATPNAVKVELINCSTSLIDSAKGVELMWIAIGAIGAFGAMLITLVMARYAWKAWNTAQQQLEATKDIALAEKRQAAMPDLLQKLRSLRESFSAGMSQKQIDGLAQDAYLAADIWAATYPAIFTAKCMRPSIARHVELVKADSYYRNPSFMLTAEQRVEQGMDEKLIETLYLSLKDDVLSLHGESMTQDQFVARRSSKRGGNR